MVKKRNFLALNKRVILLLMLLCSQTITHPLQVSAKGLISQGVIDKIKKECADAYSQDIINKLLVEGYVLTDKGGFGPSQLEVINEVFETYLESGKKFIDLGSGDGRVVFFAALFGVNATGIEYDASLHKIAVKALKELSKIIDPQKVQLIKDDFMVHDFTPYDIFYLFDGSFEGLNLHEKLSKEMKKGSILIVYDDPSLEINSLKKIRDFRIFRRNNEQNNGWNIVSVFEKQ